MTTLINLPRKQVVAIMDRENIAGSVEAFERALHEAQAHCLVAELGPLRAREAFERVDRERREAAKTEMENV